MELSSKQKTLNSLFKSLLKCRETDFVKFTGIGSYTMKFFALGSRSRVRGSLDRISFSTLGEKE